MSDNGVTFNDMLLNALGNQKTVDAIKAIIGTISVPQTNALGVTSINGTFIYGDTGRRNMVAAMNPALASGFIGLRRENSIVSLELSNALITSQSATSNYTFTNFLPAGFRPPISARLGMAQNNSSNGVLTIEGMNSGNKGNINIAPGTAVGMFQIIQWETVEPWPTVLPGTNAV